MTTPDITIPSEALEAAAKELLEQFLFLYIKRNRDPFEWDELSDEAKEDLRDKARAACLAMLRAWPDAGVECGNLVLPLPQEPRHE